MAQGINLRSRLSLPQLSLPADPTPQQLARALTDLQRNLVRWSTALPFGATGFHVRRTNNQAAIAHATGSAVKFNAVVFDQEGWAGTAASGTEQSSFVCPPGLSGWYMCQLNVRINAAVSDWFPIIQGAGLGYGQVRSVLNDREQVLALVPVKDGEALGGYLINSSGAARTILYAAQGGADPWWPSFIARRISLL